MKSLIYLVGMPGSGKSTLGKKLAKELQYNFIDLDILVETEAKTSISHLFEHQGEDAFRELERNCLALTFNNTNTIVSCGGGTPAYNTNMENMVTHGLCIYLQADIKLLASRIFYAKQARPLFTMLNKIQVEEKLNNLFIKREPFYKMAQYTINLPLKSTKQLVKQIKEQILQL